MAKRHIEEKVFFNEGDITVTSSRFIVNGQTYAMNSVTSVKSGRKDPGRGGSIIGILIGVTMLLVGEGIISLFGIIFIIGSVVLWASKKTEYSVILNTASGENQALRSKDLLYIRTVINALNDSIVSRG